MSFHIAKSGATEICRATVRACPLGGDEVHFETTAEAARYVMEQSMGQTTPPKKTMTLHERQAVAEDPSTSPEVLAELANDEELWVRTHVARNKNTPAEVLEKLANDEEWTVRRSAGENPNAPIEVREKIAAIKKRQHVAGHSRAPVELITELANDEEAIVREAVARNLNAPDETLRKLAGDENYYVRVNVARNESAPTDILEKLAEEGSGFRYHIAQNDKASPGVLRKIAQNEIAQEEDPHDVLRMLSQNLNAPSDMLEEIADYSDYYVHLNVAEHPNTSPETLRKLAGNKDEDVRKAAKKALRDRS